MSTQNPKPKTKMFEVRPGQHRPKLVRNGALFGLFMVLAVYVMYFRPPIPVLSQTGTEIKADLAEATNIRPGFTPVRVAGITVGQVTKADDLGPGQGFRITMELEDDTGVGDIYQNARADSRWRTLLGRNHYIDLEPGTKSAGELSGPIPLKQTGGQIELDEALDTFDRQGRDSLGGIVGEFNKGFSDPPSVRSALRAAAPSLREVGPALDALQGRREGELSSMVLQTGRAMGALSRDEKALGELVDRGALATGVIAARRADLGETLRNAPAALRQTRSTAVRLRTTLDELDPLAAELRPGARVLDDAAIQTRSMLAKATPLLVDARPTFRDLAPAARSARTAAASGAPALKNFTPILTTFKDTLIPYFNEKDEETKLENYKVIGPTLSSVAGVMSIGDSKGALARFQAGVGTDGLGSQMSPCRTDFFDEYTTTAEGKFKCELLTQIITGGYEGKRSFRDSRYTQRLVPYELISKVLTGKLKIKTAIDQLQTLTKARKAGGNR